MELNIAGEHILLSIPFDRQDRARHAERGVASLYDSWKRRFPAKSDRELLAMLAYQYASFYYELLERQEQSAAIADACRLRLDDMLDAANAAGIDSADTRR